MQASTQNLTKDVVEDALRYLPHLWNAVTGPFVPVPTPVSLERRNLEHLRDTQANYLVAKKHDGIRKLLLAGRVQEGPPNAYIVLIDRARQVEVLWVGTPRFGEKCFDGTLLDGEWMAYGTFGTYVCFDAMAVEGYDVS